MKAVVVEVGRKYTILLTRQGEYVRVRTLPHYKVGYEIDYTPVSAMKHWAKIASVAAVLVLCLGIGGFIYAYTTPYSYVNLDINPSVEIAVNRFDYIIDVKFFNGENETLLSRQSVINKPLRHGVDILLERLEQEAYLPEDSQSTLLFTIASENQRKIERFEKAIGEAIGRRLRNQNKVEVYVIHTDILTHTNAEKYNLSSGRYWLIRELQSATDQELNPAVMRDVSIAQILKMVKENTRELTDSERSTLRRGLIKQITVRVTRQFLEQQENRQEQERRDTGQQGQEQQDNRQEQGQESRENKQQKERQESLQEREHRDTGQQGQEQQDNRQEQGQESRENKQQKERQENRQEQEDADSRSGQERDTAVLSVRGANSQTVYRSRVAERAKGN